MRNALTALDGAAAKKELDETGAVTLHLADGDVSLAAEDLLTLDLTVNWLPGSGRLEWRTQEGAEFHINILLENYSGLADNDLSM